MAKVEVRISAFRSQIKIILWQIEGSREIKEIRDLVNRVRPRVGQGHLPASCEALRHAGLQCVITRRRRRIEYCESSESGLWAIQVRGIAEWRSRHRRTEPFTSLRQREEQRIEWCGRRIQPSIRRAETGQIH